MSPDDEMLELHEIFFKDLNDVSEEYEKLCKNVYGGSKMENPYSDILFWACFRYFRLRALKICFN